MTSLLLLTLVVVTIQTISAQECTLCYLDESPSPPEAVNNDVCAQLITEVDGIPFASDPACVTLQVEAHLNCGCPPVAIEADPCPMCVNAAVLPFPERLVYREGFDPITCQDLEIQAGSNDTTCAEIDKYRYYCGCPNEASPCPLCAGGNDALSSNLELKGLNPPFIPAEAYTCQEAARQRSLVGSDACSTNDSDYEDLVDLCGCDLPVDYNCSSLCLDETLIEGSFHDVVVLENQPGFDGTLTCYDYQLIASRGLFDGPNCNNAQYVGTKYCGCPINELFCDLCEDGTPVSREVLAQEATFRTTCLDNAGFAFATDPEAEDCPALRNTMGIYCGCDNPIASQGACRICDVDGGEVVPDSNLTVPIIGSPGDVADCGILEFIGNNPADSFSCQDVTEFGAQCCENAPSVAPTVSMTPTVTAAPTTSSLPTLFPSISMPPSTVSMLPSTVSISPSTSTKPSMSDSSASPSKSDSSSPSSTPSVSSSPSMKPSGVTTPEPSLEPTMEPTDPEPTANPTASPSESFQPSPGATFPSSAPDVWGYGRTWFVLVLVVWVRLVFE